MAKDGTELPEMIFYTALYNEKNELEEIYLEAIQTDENGYVSFVIPQPKTEEGENIKYMLWTKEILKPVVNLKI